MRPTTRARKISVAPLLTRLVREEKVGPWCIGDERAAIQSGTTYAVIHATSRERAALDVYDVPPLAFGSYAEKLRPLMHAVNRLGHAGVVKIHDVGALADGRPYVVRERVEGTLLSALVAATPMGEAQAIAIMCAICDVLVAAHAAGLVHRSLVLEHVVVLADGGVKLLDWGIADDLTHQIKPGASSPRRSMCAADDASAFGVLMHRLLKWVPRSLERLWVSLLSEDPAARPTMAQVQRELAALPTSAPPRAAKVYAVPRTVTQPGVAPPPPAPAAAAPIVEACVEASVPEFVEEEHVKTIQKPLTALRAIATPADETPDADESQPAEAAAESESSSATFDTPTVARAATKPRGRTRARIWQALALAGACAVPMVVSVVLSSDTHVAADNPAAVPVADQQRAVERVQMQAMPAQPSKHVEAPVAHEAVVTREPVTPAPSIASSERPVQRVAAKSSRRPSRSKLVSASGAGPAVAAVPTDDTEREALLAQYERVVHNLLLAKRDLGPEAVAQVTQRLEWIKLDAALATKTSRQLMAKTLQQLQAQLDAARAR